MAKKYFAVTMDGLYELLFESNKIERHCYEIIEDKCSAKLYYDLEMKCPESQDFTETQSRHFLELIVDTLVKFVHFALGAVCQPIVLQSCSPQKFSLHIIFPTVILDTHMFSARYLVECSRLYVNDRFQKMIINEEGTQELRQMIDRALNVGLIDDSVYKRHQLYRMVGNTKIGQQRWLHEYSTGSLFKKCFTKPCKQLFLNSLVTRRCASSVGHLPLVIAKPAWFKISSLNLKRYEETYPSAPKCSMSQECQELCEQLHTEYYYERSHTNQRKAAMRTEQAVTRIIADRRIDQEQPEGQEKNRLLLDGDKYIILANNTRIFANDVEHGIDVFCPWCETEQNEHRKYNLWTNVRGRGESSARTFKFMRSNELRRGIHCFNCEKTTIILPAVVHVATAATMLESVDSNLLAPEGYLTPEASGLYGTERLCFVDAPMGYGKTTMLAEYLKTVHKPRVLILTFRRALCTFLADSFNNSNIDIDCYLDESFTWDNLKAKSYLGETSTLRLVLCIDSICHIPSVERLQGFDVVAIDECQFTMTQLTSELRQIRDRWQNMEALREILKNSTKIVCMQHMISDYCKEFYTRFAQRDTELEATVSSKRLDAPLSLMPMRYSTRHDDLLPYVQNMLQYYLLNIQPGGSRKPFIVFTTSVEFAELLFGLLRAAVTETRPDLPGALDRILILTKHTADRAAQKRFAQNPCSPPFYDVVITTPVLQAGVSISNHFVTAFDFLFAGPLTTREEIQLTSRLRSKGRTDMEPFRYAWIQSGKPGHVKAHRKDILESQLEMAGFKDRVESFNNNVDIQYHYWSIVSELSSELADSINRHAWLYVQQYRFSEQIHDLFDAPLDDNLSLTGSVEWIKKTTRTLRKDCFESVSNWLISIDDKNAECLYKPSPQSLFVLTGHDTAMTSLMSTIGSLQKPQVPCRELEGTVVLANTVAADHLGLRNKFTLPSFCRALQTTEVLNRFLNVCIAAKIAPDRFLEFVEDPSTKSCLNEPLVNTLLESPFLVFAVWLAVKTKLICIDKDEPFIPQNLITRDGKKRYMMLDIDTDEKNSLEILETWERLGCQAIKGISSNTLHERLRILRSVKDGTIDAAAAAKPGKASVASILGNAMKAVNFPVHTQGHGKAQFCYDDFLTSVAVVMAFEMQNPPRPPKGSVLDTIKTAIPWIILDAVECFRDATVADYRPLWNDQEHRRISHTFAPLHKIFTPDSPMFHEKALELAQSNASHFQNMPNFRGVNLTVNNTVNNTYAPVYNIVYQGSEGSAPNLDDAIRHAHEVTGTTVASNTTRQTPARITMVSEPTSPITRGTVTPVEVSEPTSPITRGTVTPVEVSEPTSPITRGTVTPVEVSEPISRKPGKRIYRKRTYATRDLSYREKRKSRALFT